MKTLVPLAFKAVNGGLFVVAFALIAEVLKPKRFAGLLSAAPSVALANLTVVVLAEGHRAAIAGTRGMLVGAAALVVGCLVGAPVVRRCGALPGSAAIIGTRLVAAVAGYWLLLA
jgi:hypothetical protein